MNKKTLILLSIIGLGIIFLLCVLSHRNTIEKEVAQCSQNILNKAGLSNLTTNTQNRGRDVMITGFVESNNSKTKALKLLHNQCHITALNNQIQIIKPKTKLKPSKKAHIKIAFNENNELVTFSGITARETLDTKFGFLMDSYKRANDFNLSINSHKDVIPTDYHKYLSALLPHLDNINAAKIAFDGTQITLQGNVSSTESKNNIGQSIQQNLSDQTTIVNLLSVNMLNNQSTIEKKQEYQPLDANLCQQELTSLLSKSKIQFNSGSSQISHQSYDLLDHLAITILSCQGVTVEIIGHTDNSGNENNNIKLSKLRAIAVANYLFKKGVTKGKLTGKGVGSSQPLASNQTQRGRSHNRRIEFKAHSLEE